MKNQSSLGGRTTNRQPEFGVNRLAKVTSVKDYERFGRIEVIFLDYSQPVPVWIINNMDREPVEGDTVLIGYMDNRKDAPYMIGFQRNGSYSSNFITVARDKIRVQLPVFDIGVKGGLAHQDVQGNLLDESKLPMRAYVELSADQAVVHYPADKKGAASSITMTATDTTIQYGTGHIKISEAGFEFFHPTGSALFKLPQGEMKVEKG
ncbi:hypothetical protein [Paenibacillus shenyangensis]|uniref:hypothetical protein n=1 Tax=Paenibacillus sp. A9 TaxID=1284352 RepID=UPI00035D6A0C|nr:hypothetical protein [Paenibacillus sp. A9]